MKPRRDYEGIIITPLKRLYSISISSYLHLLMDLKLAYLYTIREDILMFKTNAIYCSVNARPQRSPSLLASGAFVRQTFLFPRPHRWRDSNDSGGWGREWKPCLNIRYVPDSWLQKLLSVCPSEGLWLASGVHWVLLRLRAVYCSLNGPWSAASYFAFATHGLYGTFRKK